MSELNLKKTKQILRTVIMWKTLAALGMLITVIAYISTIETPYEAYTLQCVYAAGTFGLVTFICSWLILFALSIDTQTKKEEST